MGRFAMEAEGSEGACVAVGTAGLMQAQLTASINGLLEEPLTDHETIENPEVPVENVERDAVTHQEGIVQGVREEGVYGEKHAELKPGVVDVLEGKNNSGSTSSQSAVDEKGVSVNAFRGKDAFRTDADFAAVHAKRAVSMEGAKDAEEWLHTNKCSTLIRRSVSMTTSAIDAAQDLHGQLVLVRQTLRNHPKTSLHLPALFSTSSIDQYIQSLTKQIDHALNQTMTVLDLCFRNAAASERLREILCRQSLELCLFRPPAHRNVFHIFRAGIAAQTAEAREDEETGTPEKPSPLEGQASDTEEMDLEIGRLCAELEEKDELILDLREEVQHAQRKDELILELREELQRARNGHFILDACSTQQNYHNSNTGSGSSRSSISSTLQTTNMCSSPPPLMDCHMDVQQANSMFEDENPAFKGQNDLLLKSDMTVELFAGESRQSRQLGQATVTANVTSPTDQHSVTDASRFQLKQGVELSPATRADEHWGCMDPRVVGSDGLDHTCEVKEILQRPPPSTPRPSNLCDSTPSPLNLRVSADPLQEMNAATLPSHADGVHVCAHEKIVSGLSLMASPTESCGQSSCAASGIRNEQDTSSEICAPSNLMETSMLHVDGVDENCIHAESDGNDSPILPVSVVHEQCECNDESTSPASYVPSLPYSSRHSPRQTSRLHAEPCEGTSKRDASASHDNEFIAAVQNKTDRGCSGSSVETCGATHKGEHNEGWEDWTYAPPAAFSSPQQPNMCDSRRRITNEPVTGHISKWMGKFGWIVPDKPLGRSWTQNPERIYIAAGDIVNATKCLRNDHCSFHIYETAKGLGAENCIIVNGATSSERSGEQLGNAWLTTSTWAPYPQSPGTTMNSKRRAMESNWRSGRTPQCRSHADACMDRENVHSQPKSARPSMTRAAGKWPSTASTRSGWAASR